MFVGLFIAGVATGAVGAIGGRKLIDQIKENRKKDKAIDAMREELKELKDEVYKRKA